MKSAHIFTDPNFLVGMRRRLRPKDAAQYIGWSESTLAKKRMAGDGPAYIKLGRSVLYELDELDRFLASRRRTSTSDLGQNAQDQLAKLDAVDAPKNQTASPPPAMLPPAPKTKSKTE